MKYFISFLLLISSSWLNASTIWCESHNNQYQFCKVKNTGDVKLKQQYSKRPCIKSVSWGHDKTGVWVDKGCRGRFSVNNGVTALPSPTHQLKTIRCASVNNSYKQCVIDGVDSVTLHKRISGAKCRRGHSWGVDYRGIWVDKGCDAIFRYREDTQNHTFRLQCGSVDQQYKYCRGRTLGNVELTQKISGADCRFGKSWGFDAAGVWVDKGCEAIFTLGGKKPYQPSPNDNASIAYGGQRVLCESEHGRRKHCTADTSYGVRLERQVSGAKCRKGMSWGFDESGIWVKQGCAAWFAVGSRW